MPDYRCITCDCFETLSFMTPDCCSSCGSRITPVPNIEAIAFDFISATEEGFLLVPGYLFELVDLDISDLHASSRRSPADMLALAEEPDAIRFMDLWQQRFAPVRLHENRLGLSAIANWPAAHSQLQRLAS